MQFGIVGRMCPGLRQVVGFEDKSMGRSNFVGKCGAPYCNQWGVCGIAAPFHITLGFLVMIIIINYKLITVMLICQ